MYLKDINKNVRVLLMQTNSPKLQMFVEDRLKQVLRVKTESIIDIENKEDLQKIGEILNILPPIGVSWLIRVNLSTCRGKELINLIKKSTTCTFLLRSEYYQHYKMIADQLREEDGYLSYYATYLTRPDFLYLYDSFVKDDTKLSKILYDFTYQSYSNDIEAVFNLFLQMNEGRKFESRKEISEVCGISNNSVEGFMLQLLKPLTGTIRGLKTVLRLRIKAGTDLGETLTYSTFYNYLKNGVDSCIDIKMLQISGIIYKEIKGLPDGYDEKKLSKYQRYLYKITEIPMSSFLRLANQLKECDRWKEELDFMQFIYKWYDEELKNLIAFKEELEAK